MGEKPKRPITREDFLKHHRWEKVGRELNEIIYGPDTKTPELEIEF